MNKPTIILGIDPGTVAMGYGVLSITGNDLQMVEMGVLHLSKREDHGERLQLIYAKVSSLIRVHAPVAVAIEAPFFGKNVQSMLKLGRAQGVAIAAAMGMGIKTEEYAPRKIKQSITGRGNATKEQVWELLRHTLSITGDSPLLDASDALAAALCHHYQSRHPYLSSPSATSKTSKRSKPTSWADFLSDNPDRIK